MLGSQFICSEKGRSPKPGPTKKSSVRLSTYTTIHIKRHYNPFLTPERYLYYSTSLAWKDRPGFKTKEPTGFALLLFPVISKNTPQPAPGTRFRESAPLLRVQAERGRRNEKFKVSAFETDSRQVLVCVDLNTKESSLKTYLLPRERGHTKQPCLANAFSLQDVVAKD